MIAIRLNPCVIFCKAGLHFETDGIPVNRGAAIIRGGDSAIHFAEDWSYCGQNSPDAEDCISPALFYVISSLESPRERSAPSLRILIGMNQLGSVHPRFSRVVAAISRPISRLLLAAIR
jgi:hypothetical protein